MLVSTIIKNSILLNAAPFALSVIYSTNISNYYQNCIFPCRNGKSNNLSKWYKNLSLTDHKIFYYLLHCFV